MNSINNGKSLSTISRYVAEGAKYTILANAGETNSLARPHR